MWRPRADLDDAQRAVGQRLSRLLGVHAPGISDEREAAAAHHHLLLAHGEAVGRFRESSATGMIGIALNLMHIYPASNDPADLTAAEIADAQLNRSFLDPLFGKGYPKTLHRSGPIGRPITAWCRTATSRRSPGRSISSRSSPITRDGSARRQSGPSAGGGVRRTGRRAAVVRNAVCGCRPGGGGEDPDGLADPRRRLSRPAAALVGRLRCYISENGFAGSDYRDQAGFSIDPNRSTTRRASARPRAASPDTAT